MLYNYTMHIKIKTNKDAPKKQHIYERRRKRLNALVFIALAAAVFFVWAFYAGLTVTTYEKKSIKAPRGVTVRVVVIADLHSHVYSKDQKPLLDMIKSQNPDMIALVGDIVDDDEPEAGAKLFLHDIAGIAPAYYVSGNHEYWSGHCNEIKDMIRGYGITVLDNEREYIRVNGMRLCICGIDDPEVFEYAEDGELLGIAEYDDLLNRFSDIGDGTVNILLAHRPERIEDYKKYDFDVVLSGHTHGGQVRIPLLVNGLFAPDQGLLPKYAGGLYSFGDMTMIVSRGLSFNARLPRIFNPPEVVIVDIKGE